MASATTVQGGVFGFARRTLNARGGAFAMLQTLLAQGMTMGVNLATGVLTARMLGPVGRGEFAAAGMWLLLPSLLAMSGIQNGIVYAARRDPARRAAVAGAGVLLSLGAYLPLTVIAWFALPWLMHAYGDDVLYLSRVCLIAAVLNVLNVAVRQSLLAEQDFRAFNMLSSGAAAIYLAVLIGLAVAGLITPVTAILAQISGTVVVFVWGALRLFRGWRGLPWRPWALLRPLISYSTRAAPIDLITVLTGNVDRLVLIKLVSVTDFGLYAVAISFARIVVILQTAISSVTLADLTGQGRAETEIFLHQTFRMLVLLLVLACGLVLLVDRPLLLLAYGNGFGRAVPIFRVLLGDAALACIGQVLMQIYLARGRPAIASGAQVAAFLTTGLGVWLLAPPLGAIGAAMALVCGSVVRLGVLLVLLPRIGLARPSPLPRWSDLILIVDRVRPLLARGTT